jgi:hypothetical protein
MRLEESGIVKIIYPEEKADLSTNETKEDGANE